MSRRGDALTALIREVAALNQDIVEAREVEEAARIESVAARQALDNARKERERREERLDSTREALGLIQRRDEIADDTIAALLDREVGR